MTPRRAHRLHLRSSAVLACPMRPRCRRPVNGSRPQAARPGNGRDRHPPQPQPTGKGPKLELKVSRHSERRPRMRARRASKSAGPRQGRRAERLLTAMREGARASAPTPPRQRGEAPAGRPPAERLRRLAARGCRSQRDGAGRWRLAGRGGEPARRRTRTAPPAAAGEPDPAAIPECSEDQSRRRTRGLGQGRRTPMRLGFGRSALLRTERDHLRRGIFVSAEPPRDGRSRPLMRARAATISGPPQP